MEERPSEIVLMQQLEEGGPDPLVFVLNANLLAMVKLVNCELPSQCVFLPCKECWYHFQSYLAVGKKQKLPTEEEGMALPHFKDYFYAA